MADDCGRGLVREGASLHARGGEAGGGAELSSLRMGAGEERLEKGAGPRRRAGGGGAWSHRWRGRAGERWSAVQNGRGLVGKGRAHCTGGVLLEKGGVNRGTGKRRGYCQHRAELGEKEAGNGRSQVSGGARGPGVDRGSVLPGFRTFGFGGLSDWGSRDDGKRG